MEIVTIAIRAGLVHAIAEAGRGAVPAVAISIVAVGGGHIAHAGAGLAPGIPGVGVRALHYGLVAEAADRIDVAAVVGAGLQAGAADAAGPSGGMQHERRCQYGFLHHP